MLGISRLLATLGYTKVSDIKSPELKDVIETVESTVSNIRENSRIRDVQLAATNAAINTAVLAYNEFCSALDTETLARRNRKGPKVLASAKEQLEKTRGELNTAMLALKLRCDLRDSFNIDEAVAALEETIKEK